MVKRGGREVITVEIYKENYNYFKENAIKNKRETKEYINEILELNVEKDKMLQIHTPSLEMIGVSNQVLYIKDNRKNKIVEIRMSEGRLFCTDDDPIYLQFAWALPELAKLNTQKNNNL